jgi:Uma2 family endonuclease
MSVMTTAAYRLDPSDPRAPTEEQWEALSNEERARVVASLPTDMPWELHPPEGDEHREPKDTARDALGEYFRRKGRRVYVSSELVTYYPDEPRFCPDVLAVLDVDPHKRQSWVVSHEGRGLDFVLEVHVSGSAQKDFEHNVVRYARLGIPEYFAFDRPRSRLWGWRLAEPSGASYERLVPQAGRLRSAVLGLELTVEGGRVRFYEGSAPLLFVDELVGRLETMVDELIEARDTAVRRAEDEARRAEDEARRAEDEAGRREELERELARLREELDRRR